MGETELNDEKTCPFCAEKIKAAAVVCKHCGRNLTAPLHMPIPTTVVSTGKGKKQGEISTPAGLAIFAIVIVLGVLYGLSGQKGMPDVTQMIGAADIRTSVATKIEYDALEDGMTYSEVVMVIGEPGTETASSKIDGVPGVMNSVSTKMYVWQNPDGSNMNAMFQNDKMIQKAQFGLK